MCGDFKRGDCSRGDRCRFSHGGGGGGRSGGGGGGGGGSKLDDRGKWGKSWGNEKEMCGDFKRGDCSRGDRCRFSHGDDGGDSKRAKTDGKYDKKICGDFARGDCTRGDRCKFSHEDLKKTLDDDLDAYFGKAPAKKATTEEGKLDSKLDDYFAKGSKEAKETVTVKCSHPDCTLAVHSDKSVSDKFCCKLCQEADQKDPKGSPAHGKRCENVTHKEKKKEEEDKKETAGEEKADDKKVEEPKGDESE